MEKRKANEILLSGLFIIIFLFFSEIVTYILLALNINPNNMSLGLQRIYIMLMELIFIFIIMLKYKKDYKKSFKDFKEKYNFYFKKYLKYYLTGIAVMMLSNLILASTFNQIANNEEAIRSAVKVNPFFMYISAVLLAPVLEESIFRFNIRKIINEKCSYIILSGVIFASCHIVGQIYNWYDILYIIPYASLGIALARIYYESDNIFVSIMFHLIHNGILISLQFLIL